MLSEARKLGTRQQAEAQEAWDRTAEFLRAQGIRPDAPDCPIPGAKLLTVSEQVEVQLVDDAQEMP